MLFNKFFVAATALFGFASLVLANPIAHELEKKDVEARQLTDVTSLLNGLLGTVTGITSGLGPATATGGDPTAIIGDLLGALTGATSTLTDPANAGLPLGLGGATAIVSVMVSIVLNIVLSLITVVGLTATVKASVDLALNDLVVALNVFVPGIGTLIGAAIPIVDLGLLVFLDLSSVISVLGLVSILGGLLGGLGL